MTATTSRDTRHLTSDLRSLGFPAMANALAAGSVTTAAGLRHITDRVGRHKHAVARPYEPGTVGEETHKRSARWLRDARDVLDRHAAGETVA